MRKRRISFRTKEKFHKRINDVIKGLSRKVLVYKQPVKSECPNCYYDKLTDSSTGKCTSGSVTEANVKQAEWEAGGNTTTRFKYFKFGRCPVCRGLGFLEVQRKRWTDCLVTWDPEARGFGNDLSYTPAGTEGSTIVQLKTDPKNYDLFKNADKVVVDGVECKISKAPLLRGLGNQAVLVITAFTTEKPSIDSNEIVKEYRR